MGGNIFWNLHEIPIPADAKRNAYDNQVSKYYKDGNGRRRRVVIGRAVTETTMHPNQNFRYYYPELWKLYYLEDVTAQHEIHFGLYALLLGAGYRSGIYPLMHDLLGPEYANAIMDYALYSINWHSSTTQLIQDSLCEQMYFSRRLLDDNWFSSFFNDKLPENLIHDFKMQWLQRCAERNQTEVWLCVDGSNSDCQMQDSLLAEHGPAKSGNNVDIISYIWAVDAETGSPITWFVERGSTHDVKALKQIATFLALSNIKVKGIILDRGFVSQETVDLIEDKLDLELVMMLKSSTNAHCEMMERHGADIRWNLRNVLQSSRNGMFGTVDKVKLFKGSQSEHYVGLFYDGSNGSARSVHFINKVLDEAERLRQLLAVNPDAAEVEHKFRKYLYIDDTGSEPEVKFIYDAWQRDMDCKGYNSIATSELMSADELNQLYTKRQASETQFSLLKSQLNSGVIRVHSDKAAHARFFVAFVASVLRTELMLTCQKYKLDINDVLRKANTASMVLMPDYNYHAVKYCAKRVLTVLGDYGIKEEHFETFVNEVNTLKTTGLGSQFKKMPGELGENKQSSTTAEANKKDEPISPKRKPGRPKGSKNKKTLEREAAEAALKAAAPKRGPGRPKGSKNKKTLEREAAEAAMKAAAPKRGPGRPKGSKNKKTLEREAAEAALKAAAQRRGPGRPKGSKNKKTLEREAAEAAMKAAAPKRGPGRPKGSKNKKTLERDAQAASQALGP